MFSVKVDGMTVKLCRSFHEAKTYARNHGGKVFGYVNAKMPKAAALSYNDPWYAKREMYREIYSENNHGYHLKGRRYNAGV